MNRSSLALLVFAAACAQSAQSVNPAPSATSSTTTTSTATTTPTGSTSSTRTVTTTTTTGFSPIGSYVFQTDINGQAVSGTMNIRSENGVLVGLISAEGQGDFPISTVKVDGTTVTIIFDTPNGAGTAKLEFTGSDFTGGWELGGQTGPMKGKRSP
jgi:hypothetical protein